MKPGQSKTTPSLSGAGAIQEGVYSGLLFMCVSERARCPACCCRLYRALETLHAFTTPQKNHHRHREEYFLFRRCHDYCRRPRSRLPTQARHKEKGEPKNTTNARQDDLGKPCGGFGFHRVVLNSMGSFQVGQGRQRIDPFAVPSSTGSGQYTVCGVYRVVNGRPGVRTQPAVLQWCQQAATKRPKIEHERRQDFPIG